MFEPTNEELFNNLYFSPTEEDVDLIIQKYPNIFRDDNWFPLGGNENMFGIVRNQQSNPIAALVEKVTNSIDAILLKECLEKGIAPDSEQAPKSMDEALKLFYPDSKNWDLKENRRKQAENIQIIADGPTRNTSVIMYDNGEGQHPEKFEDTFLSLVRGNKINIQFVQGKYNMGGSGALIFCGKKRYQLICSKRFDGTGQFGFTLIRQRKISVAGENRRSSHFEFLKLDGKIPSFDIDELDLKLFGRKFKTGTIIKMYSYQFPPGYSGFAQELNQSLNEFLFEPLLPLITIDNKKRYPKNNVLELDLFGLKRRLEQAQSKYIDTYFSEEYTDELFGQAKVTCYVFKPKSKNRDVKKTKEIIRDRFFKNQMSVMFSINGQVHGSFTAEFISRNLKFNLLKDYLLIHVDCTQMDPDFREELFMASRDRLKQGPEAIALRDYLGKRLRKSDLDEINRRRKESIGLDGEDTSDLIKSLSKNLPKDSELFKLLHSTLKLEDKKEEKKPNQGQSKPKPEPKPFLPQRFPTKFHLYNRKDGINIISLPRNGDRIVKFETDVENSYFDRTEDPGELQLAVLQIKRNKQTDGTQAGTSTEISGLLNIVKSSPNKGTIRLTLEPKEELNVGDEIEIKASLTAPGAPFEELILVKITSPEATKSDAIGKEEEQEQLGLPVLKKVYEADWPNLAEQGITMNHQTVLFPFSEDDKLEQIFINMDSHVFLSHKSKYKTEEQILTAERKFISAIYFHTLFLYMITKRKNYTISRNIEGRDIDVTNDEMITDVFNSYYSDFLLNFGMEQLMNALEE